jgi:glucose uptake protein
MFVVDNVSLAILFCIVTMLGWGSWANTQKLAGKDRWPFPLFYWDYAIGVLIFGVLFALTVGSFGSAGEPALANLAHASSPAIVRAVLSGVLFNISNILLVVAIDAAGMSLAFPVGVGLALVIGTVVSYLQTPKGSAPMLFSGVALVVFAMVFSALAYAKLPRREGVHPARGIIYSVIAGCLMGYFYPQLIGAVSPAFQSQPIKPGLLTPYSALLLFGAGVFVSNFVVNGIFLKVNHLKYSDYRAGSVRLHSIGVLGGVIWMLALCLNVIASGIAGPAVSYALGQGATLIAAIWGVFIWKEFKSAPRAVAPLIVLMFLGYAAGLALIGIATL